MWFTRKPAGQSGPGENLVQIVLSSALLGVLGSLLGSVIGVSVVGGLYLSGWKRSLAERGSRRGLGTVGALRWTIASQYQLPLGTFLGIAALAIVYLGPVVVSAWPALGGILG